jgi:hypothetical protein
MTGQSEGGDAPMSDTSDAVVLQDWCDWCDADEVEISHKIEVPRMEITAWFCSRECASEWGCAADQDRIEEVA